MYETCVYTDTYSCTILMGGGGGGVLWRQPHRRSGLATLPSVGAVP